MQYKQQIFSFVLDSVAPESGVRFLRIQKASKVEGNIGNSDLTHEPFIFLLENIVKKGANEIISTTFAFDVCES